MRKLFDWLDGDKNPKLTPLLVGQNRSILEVWASGRTDTNLENCFSKNPSTTEIQQNKGRKELSRLAPWSHRVNSCCVCVCRWIGRFGFSKRGWYKKWSYLLPKRFVFLWNSQQSFFSFCVVPNGGPTSSNSAWGPERDSRVLLPPPDLSQQYSRNWLRLSKAEGARVLSYSVFVGFRL